MKPFISSFYKTPAILTPNDSAHYFFGYYDMRAERGGRHLCHRVAFMDRLPTREDVCELGYLENGQFFKFAETVAWNFQQGAMLQYHPTRRDTVIYNAVKDGRFVTVTHNYITNEKSYAERATACISPDGKYGLAINFGRIYAFRPGYGYAGFADENADVAAPENDGVFLVDLERGCSKQIISYAELAPVAGFQNGEKVLVNHITFDPSGKRFVMLVRDFRTEEKPWWTTSLVISDIQGNCRTVLKNTYVSHYDWKDASHLLAHCTVEGEKKGMYLIDMDGGEWVEYDMPYFHGEYNSDIHCNYSSDRRYIIGDGYPIDGYRYLMAYNTETGESRELLRVKTETPHGITDIRCDLHARFTCGGKYISFDTVHNGRREIAVVDTTALQF